MTQCSEVLSPFGAVTVWIIMLGGFFTLALVFPWVLALLSRYWSWVERVTGGVR